MMSFKMKLTQVCLVVCLLVSLVGFAVAADMSLESSYGRESYMGAWVLQDGNHTEGWSQIIAGGCQMPDAGMCNSGG